MKLMKCLLCLNLLKEIILLFKRVEGWILWKAMEVKKKKKSSLQREQKVFIQDSKCSYSILGGSAIHSVYIGLEM